MLQESIPVAFLIVDRILDTLVKTLPSKTSFADGKDRIVTCMPLPSMNKATHFGSDETSPKVHNKGINGPTKVLMSSKYFLENNINKNK